MLMNKEKNKGKAYLQIFLLVSASFAFAYILSETSGESVYLQIKKKKINWMAILRIAIGMIFSDKTFVSALEESDLSEGVATCVVSLDGSVCQEYAASECDSHCNGSCFPSNRDATPGCRVGVCYDQDEGTCQERATQRQCEANGGELVSSNDARCERRCCVVGDSVRPLVTQRECEIIGARLGIETEYRPEIGNELSCLALAQEQDEGACVFDISGERSCRFLTGIECLERGGEFYEGLLCTHPSLEMSYERQATARCVEGKDEIYWFDGEGNRENIYDANRVRSWNSGRVLPKSESCELENSRDQLANQRTCGNCNRFLGSSCGEKTSEESLSDSSIDFVCRDARCRDSYGNIRENGESWCEYQGAIGTYYGSGGSGRGSAENEKEGFLRSADTPGSRHFRMSCVDSEVITNPCADYRNEICVEQQNERTDGEDVSSAACVKNLWQLCLNYNAQVKGQGQERTDSIEKRNELCVKNPNCILKKIDIANNFKFDLCSPKYAPGFDLQRNAEGGELSCAFANQKCTVVFVKKLSGWKAEVNEGCLKPRFAEQMNDLCMSLGDCGASVNYNGDLSESYKVRRSPRLSASYLNEIRRYSESVRGQFVELNVTAYYNAIGGTERLAGRFDPSLCGGLPGGDAAEALCPEDLNTIGMISGAAGVALAYGISEGYIAAIAIPSAPYIAFSGVLAGAAIGFAVTALLIQYTGIGAGLDPAITWSLIGAGTAAGTIIGASITASFLGTSSPAWLSALASLGPIGWIILIIVIIVIVIFVAIGIGDTKKRVVSFECGVWQPPLGGAKCEECGKDGKPCSPYACQALGQTCRLINEGTTDERCVDISPNDVSPPVISPLREALSEGYRYIDESNNGVSIETEDGECVSADSTILFGISLNEPGQCVYDFEHKERFDDAESYLGGSSVFREKHVQVFSGFELREMGELDLPEFEPNAREEFNFHVRCRDGNGNENVNEYLINFCVSPGEDLNLPFVTARDPGREQVAFNASSVSGAVFVSEPAECRWSLNADDSFSEMENEMECFNNIADRNPLFGWRCGSVFPIDENEEKFYIQCLDQPWENETSKRNEMSDSYEFILRRTRSPLVIESVEPNNETLEFGVVPASVVLEVRTSGGVDNGRATCSLLGSPMAETFENVHRQTFNQILNREYEFLIMCEDLAGNTASALSKFNVVLDVASPLVTRVYNKGGKLIIVTNEAGECAFIKGIGQRRNACNFEFENATLMSGAGFAHTVDFDEKTHYVKCKDRFENIPGECSVIVRGGLV